MLILSVAPFSYYKVPPVFLDQLNHVTNLHHHYLLLNEPHVEPFDLLRGDGDLIVSDDSKHTAFAQECLRLCERGDLEDERLNRVGVRGHATGRPSVSVSSEKIARGSSTRAMT